MSSTKMNESHVADGMRYAYTENDNDAVKKEPPNTNSEQIEKKEKKKITIEVDEDDPCLKGKEGDVLSKSVIRVPGTDPRFQQQNQTLRCWVMYTDFYRCEHILGEGSDACAWFKQVFTTICPKYWIDHWDNLRAEGKFPWHKYKTQGEFPGDKYGV